MKLYIYAAIAALVVAAIGGAALAGYRHGKLVAGADAARTAALIAEASEAAQQAAAKAIAQIKIVNRTNYNEIQRETRVVPDYTACRNSDVGLRILNAALEGRPAVAAGSGGVPDADAAGR